MSMEGVLERIVDKCSDADLKVIREEISQYKPRWVIETLKALANEQHSYRNQNLKEMG